MGGGGCSGVTALIKRSDDNVIRPDSVANYVVTRLLGQEQRGEKNEKKDANALWRNAAATVVQKHSDIP